MRRLNDNRSEDWKSCKQRSISINHEILGQNSNYFQKASGVQAPGQLNVGPLSSKSVTQLTFIVLSSARTIACGSCHSKVIQVMTSILTSKKLDKKLKRKVQLNKYPWGGRFKNLYYNPLKLGRICTKTCKLPRKNWIRPEFHNYESQHSLPEHQAKPRASANFMRIKGLLCGENR